MEQTAKVVNAVMKLGPSYTRISEVTGVPISTVRYILNEKLPKLGLTVRASVNYSMLGLERYLVFLNTNLPPHQMSTLLDLFGELMYLDYYSLLMKERKFFAFFVIPPEFESSFYSFLDELSEVGILRNYDVRKLNYMKVIPFRAEFFDFRKGVWLQNWDEKTVEVSISGSETTSKLKICQLDLKILAELQKNAFVKHVELARKLKASRQTIKRHYENIIKAISLYAIFWVPLKTPELIATPMITSLPSTHTARKTVLNIPFSYMEMSSEEREYYAMFLLPSIGFYKTMKYLADHVKVKWIDFPSMEYAARFLVHYNLYKDHVGWINSFEKGIEKILEEVKQFKRRV